MKYYMSVAAIIIGLSCVFIDACGGSMGGTTKRYDVEVIAIGDCRVFLWHNSYGSDMELAGECSTVTAGTIGSMR